MKTSHVIPITVVMRSYNDAKLLPRTLAALDKQRGVDIELIVIESASTDNSLKILEAYGPDQLICLRPGTYRSSAVLNHGTSLATTKLVAFINSDAILEQDDALLRMAQVMRNDQKCAGVFARQSTRPKAKAMTRLDYHIAFADDRSHLGTGANWMSLVVSMIRWSAWQEVLLMSESPMPKMRCGATISKNAGGISSICQEFRLNTATITHGTNAINAPMVTQKP